MSEITRLQRFIIGIREIEMTTPSIGDATEPCIQHTVNQYDRLRPIMHLFGATGSSEEFYWAVNRAFHAAEASRYEERHIDMFRGLKPIWEKLLGCLSRRREKLKILDIGAGTGLVGKMMAELTPSRVGSLTLLDPSPEMLNEARHKAFNAAFPCAFVQGDLSAIGPRRYGEFDVITINSVLHHVVAIEQFWSRIPVLLTPNGLVLTAQDPRAGAADDEIYTARRKRALSRRNFRRRLGNARDSILRKLRLDSPDVVAASANEALLSSGAITRPMDIQSIWAVTDFHVPGLPGDVGKGIDLGKLAECAPSLRLVQWYSYQYFGVPWTALSRSERYDSDTWWASEDQHGELIASVWQK